MFHCSASGSPPAPPRHLEKKFAESAALVIHVSWGTCASVSLGEIPRYRIVDL